MGSSPISFRRRQSSGEAVVDLLDPDGSVIRHKIDLPFPITSVADLDRGVVPIGPKDPEQLIADLFGGLHYIPPMDARRLRIFRSSV